MTKSTLIEAHSIDYVPLAERHGKVWHLWPVWFSGEAHLATIAVGMIGIALGGNLLWTAIAVLTGCAIGTFFMAFHSTQGPQLGLPQMIQSRPQFGYVGALLVWAFALVTYVGYIASNQILAIQAIHELTGSISPTSPAGVIGFGLLGAALAAIGYDAIHVAQRGLALLMIALLCVFSFGGVVLFRFPSVQWSIETFNLSAFLTQMLAAAAYQLTWSICVSDYSRYLPREISVRSSFWWTYIGAFVGGAWMMLVGSVAAASDPQVDLSAALMHTADSIFPHFGSMLMAGSLLTLVTITTLNFYGASLTLLSIWDTISPLKSSVGKRVMTIIGTVVATSTIALDSSGNFIHRFSDLLTILLYLFTPWTAINLVDFYLVRKGHYSVREIFNPDGMYGRWNWHGLLAYAVGFLVMVPFFSTGIYTGPIARWLGGADMSMLVGLPVSAGIYIWFSRSLDLEADARAARLADLGLEPGKASGVRGGNITSIGPAKYNAQTS